MHGLMMQEPLLVSWLIRHADRHHGDVEIVSRRIEGDVHRTTWRALHRRARQLANALGALGIADGDRVATLAWNGYRHLELYFAASGSGAVLHTVNPRLLVDQIGWIARHAQDKVLFFDLTFLPIVEQLAQQSGTIRHYVALADRNRMPVSRALPGLLCYEDLVEQASDRFDWPRFDENTASSLCYTSGTTGNPKGALYSHRSTLLHTFGIAMPDSLGLSARDAMLPVVPMFHVNAWGLPYAAAMVGAKLVFPGCQLDGKSLYDLIEQERVTLSAGVPTVWQGLLGYVEANQLRFSTMRRTVVGGAACPMAMLRLFEEKHGVAVLHAWGMTEMSPVGTVAALKEKHRDLDAEGRFAVQLHQGRAMFGVDMRIVGDDGAEQPWDGKAFGDLQVRGPWVIREYFAGEAGDVLRDGWFPTGDVASIDADGYMQITDRSKDVIKSGGEWISSIEIENIAVGHPAVAIAACIAARHPKWDERPLLVVVLKEGHSATRDEILSVFDGKVARWQIPDDVVITDAIPLGATGKILKTKLRAEYGNHYLR